MMDSTNQSITNRSQSYLFGEQKLDTSLDLKNVKKTKSKQYLNRRIRDERVATEPQPETETEAVKIGEI